MAIKTKYSVSQIKNTSDEMMGLYITDPNQVEYFITNVPAGGVSAQLMPQGATWVWKVALEANAPIRPPMLGATPPISASTDMSRTLGEGNDARKTLD